MKMKAYLMKWFIVLIGGMLYKLWFFSIRKNIQPPVPKDPFILAFWHQDIFTAIGLIAKHYRTNKIAALVSPSRDGDYLAMILKSLGITAIRGSSNSEPIEAYWNSLRALNENYILMITPDGPKGPPKKIKPGLAELSRHSGKPIDLLRFHYSFSRRLKSWDGFVIPFPLSSVRIEMSDPIVISRDENSTHRITQNMEDFLNGH